MTLRSIRGAATCIMPRRSWAETDEIGPEGVKELEDQLLSFQGYCNQMKFADGNNQLRTGEYSFTTPPRRNIPLILIKCEMFFFLTK
jgi:hypothetical protein